MFDDGLEVVIATRGSVRPVFAKRPRQRRPRLIGQVVRCPDCTCWRPHRWRAIPAKDAETYRRILAERKEHEELELLSIEVAIASIAGPRLKSIGAGVQRLLDTAGLQSPRSPAV